MNDLSRVGARVRELAARCLDGGASEAEAAELDSLIVRHPEVARELARVARMESALEVVARAHPAGAPIPMPSARRAARWATGAAVVAVAVAAAVVFVWMPRDPTARVASIPSPAASEPARVVPRVTAPVAPTPVSHHRVHFADGSFAELRDGASRISTRLSTASAVDVALEQGGARFEVVPRPGRRFRVWIGSSYVEVIGTVFTVDRLAGAVRVSVERGLVKVMSGQGETRVGAGSTQVMALDKPAVAGAVKDEPGAWLHASEVARRNGRPDEALALLRRLLDRHAGDPRAPYASFIMGRVLLEELSRPREAAAAFARVAVLDPKTPLVEDALAREVESWSRARDGERARARANTYLGRYPNGSRADEVRRYSHME